MPLPCTLFRIPFITRRAILRITVLLGLLAILLVWGFRTMVSMPGASYRGALPPLSNFDRELCVSLQKDVEALAIEIGERNVARHDNLTSAAEFIVQELDAAGYKPRRLTYSVAGRDCSNVEAELPGSAKPGEILVVGAHYDSAEGSPGANDNASGVAGVLALARSFSDRKPARTIRFVFFVNEEPPFFQTGNMGSYVYAKECRSRNENIVGMLSLETIGCFSDTRHSQSYPPPLSLFYPSTGNFIAIVGNTASRPLVKLVVQVFRKQARFPTEGACLPGGIQGVAWSDHWAFWESGYPAAMITDTAPFRYRFYHTAEDTPDKLDFDRMARVVAGTAEVLEELARR